MHINKSWLQVSYRYYVQIYLYDLFSLVDKYRQIMNQNQNLLTIQNLN
jgi:hypothetical protein